MSESEHEGNEETFLDVLEHYAVRTSDKCIKYDDLAELSGGLSSNRDYIEEKFANQIYTSCKKEWQRNLANNALITYQSKEVEKDKISYIAHNFKEPRGTETRPQIWLNTCFKMKYPKDVTYCRVFTFPCKFICEHFETTIGVLQCT